MVSQNLVVSVADRMCRSGAIDLICVDSVSALTPRAEIEVSYHVAILKFLACDIVHVSFSLALFFHIG